jgi:hypothetical protein
MAPHFLSLPLKTISRLNKLHNVMHSCNANEAKEAGKRFSAMCKSLGYEEHTVSGYIEIWDTALASHRGKNLRNAEEWLYCNVEFRTMFNQWAFDKKNKVEKEIVNPDASKPSDNGSYGAAGAANCEWGKAKPEDKSDSGFGKMVASFAIGIAILVGSAAYVQSQQPSELTKTLNEIKAKMASLNEYQDLIDNLTSKWASAHDVKTGVFAYESVSRGFEVKGASLGTLEATISYPYIMYGEVQIDTAIGIQIYQPTAQSCAIVNAQSYKSDRATLLINGTPVSVSIDKGSCNPSNKGILFVPFSEQADEFILKQLHNQAALVISFIDEKGNELFNGSLNTKGFTEQFDAATSLVNTDAKNKQDKLDKARTAKGLYKDAL